MLKNTRAQIMIWNFVFFCLISMRWRGKHVFFVPSIKRKIWKKKSSFKFTLSKDSEKNYLAKTSTLLITLRNWIRDFLCFCVIIGFMENYPLSMWAGFKGYIGYGESTQTTVKDTHSKTVPLTNTLHHKFCQNFFTAV